MTSKISFLKLMQEDFKRRSWMAALLAVVFFLAYPAAMMISLDNMMNAGDGIVYHIQDIKDWVTNFMGAGRFVHCILVIGTAVILAMGEFSYLHSKEKLDLYHSIPVRRKKLFMSGYLTGAAMFLAVFGVCQILCVLIALARGVLTTAAVYAMIKGILLRIVDFVFLYNVGIFAMLFTGNTVLAVFGTMVLVGYGPVIVFIAGAYAEIGFYTMMDSVPFSAGYTTPVGILLYLENGISQGTPYVTAALLTVIGIGVFLAADLWMCEHRQTEHAGMALAFPKMEQILKFLLVFPASLMTGLAAYSLTGTERRYWMFGGFLFGVVVFSALMEFIYHRDIKMVLHRRLGLGVTAALGFLMIACVGYDWFGVNSWLPDKDRVEAMSVGGSSGLGSNVFQIRMEGDYENGMSSREYQNVADRVKGTETTEFDRIYELAREGSEKDCRYLDGYTEIYVKYVLKNGKEVRRRYWVDAEVYQEAEDAFYQESWYKEICYPILADEQDNKPERLQRIEIGKWNGEMTTLEGEEARDLYQSYREELAAMSPEELRSGDEVCEQKEEDAAETEENVWDNVTDVYFVFYEEDGSFRQESGYPFGKKFKKTSRLLEQAESNF